MKQVVICLLAAVLAVGGGRAAGAQVAGQVSAAAADTVVLADIEFEGVPAGLALRTIARLYGLNLTVQEPLEIPITLHLQAVSAGDLFGHLAELYPIEISRRSGIWHVRALPAGRAPARLGLEWEQGRLTVEARAVPLDTLASHLARRGVMTLLAGSLGDRAVTGYLSTHDPEAGVRALLRAHGLLMSREGPGIYVAAEAAEQDIPRLEFYVEPEGVTFHLVRAPLQAVLDHFARALEWDVFFYGEITGTVTARASRMPADRALDLLLVGTGLGARLEGTSLLIGQGSRSEFGEVRLVRLSHLRYEGLIERLPASLVGGVDLQAVPEQNAVVITGPTGAINAVENFIVSIDHPVPQILFETLVVDYFDETARELGFEFGVGAPRDTSFGQWFSPRVDIETRGSYLKGGLTIGEQFRNLPVVGQLPDDFYIRLKALETMGKVRIRSRPQLATINGNPATLTVGTTQYYLIRTETTFAQQTVQTRISEHFERIEANMVLRITPWVTSSGEIIAHIRPEFSTPQENLNPEIPPTINHRSIDTVVQLRDGETIILGGLVQETTQDRERRFPLLWRLPLVGRLFVSKSKSVMTSELMIYLTPHIYHGQQVVPPPAGGVR